MTLDNYRDISKTGTDIHAGFQFEFRCASCSKTWKSQLKPYRRGQIAGLIYKFAFFLGDRGSFGRASSGIANAGEAGAKQGALQEALALAEQRYAVCPSCNHAVCENCWNPGAGRCADCLKEDGRAATRGGQVSGGGGAAAGALRCPNCSAEQTGGRFCPECGFDMASTHKSCPGCGVMCARSARFCTDCGHGF